MTDNTRVMDADATEVAGDNKTLAMLNKSEIDQQIATAHAYPRSVRTFRDEALQLATLNEQVAEECFYALPRTDKAGKRVTIEGPSARFAEIVAHSWGNCRAGARVVDEDAEFVTAQGAFMDLEKNVAITYEVKRRITGKNGKRFSADMIGVTANAACSIALRNAVFKGVPKAFWTDIFDQARKTAIGDATTLDKRRADALAYLQKMGAREEDVLRILQVKGIEDIGLDELSTLRGLANAIREGTTTVDEAFDIPSERRGTAADLNEKLAPTAGAANQGQGTTSPKPTRQTIAAEAKEEGAAASAAIDEVQMGTRTEDATPEELAIETAIEDFEKEIEAATTREQLDTIGKSLGTQPREVQEAVRGAYKKKGQALAGGKGAG